MKKIVIGFYILLFLPFVTTAQIHCRIDCQFLAAKDSTECKLVVKRLNQSNLINSTLFFDGHAIFVVDIPEPYPAYIWIENRKEDIDVFIDAPDITVTINSLHAPLPTISGSSCSKLWYQQRTALDKLIKNQADLTAEFSKASIESDSLLFEKAQSQSDSLHSIYEDSLIYLINMYPYAASSWYLFASNLLTFPHATAVQLFSKLTSFSAYSSYRTISSKLLAKRLGQPAPDFHVSTLTAEKLTLSKLTDPYVLLDFSASYLYFTKQRFNKLKKLYDKYHSKGLEIITISQEFDRQVSQLTLSNLQFPWPVVIDIQGQTNILVNYQIDRIPDNMLLDNQRKIILRDSTVEELEAKLKEVCK